MPGPYTEDEQTAYFLAIRRKMQLGEMGGGTADMLLYHINYVFSGVFPQFPDKFRCTQAQYDAACQLTPEELIGRLVEADRLHRDAHGISDYLKSAPNWLVKNRKKTIERNTKNYGEVPPELLRIEDNI